MAAEAMIRRLPLPPLTHEGDGTRRLLRPCAPSLSLLLSNLLLPRLSSIFLALFSLARL